MADEMLAPNLEQKVDVVANKLQHIIIKQDTTSLSSHTVIAPKIETVTTKEPYIPTYNFGTYFQGLGFLFLFLALLWFGVRFLKRYGRFNFIPRPTDLPKDALRMEAQLPIGPRKGLMVVRFLNKRLLLGVTDQHISLLTWEPVNVEEQPNFQELVEQAKSKDSSF